MGEAGCGNIVAVWVGNASGGRGIVGDDVEDVSQVADGNAVLDGGGLAVGSGEMVTLTVSVLVGSSAVLTGRGEGEASLPHPDASSQIPRINRIHARVS